MENGSRTEIGGRIDFRRAHSKKNNCPPFLDAKSIACVMIRHVPDVVRMHYSKMIQYGVAKRRFCFFNRTYRRWISISTQSDERSRVYTARGDFVRLVFQSLLGSSIPSTARNRYAQFREAAHHFWVPPARTYETATKVELPFEKCNSQ